MLLSGVTGKGPIYGPFLGFGQELKPYSLRAYRSSPLNPYGPNSEIPPGVLEGSPTLPCLSQTSEIALTEFFSRVTSQVNCIGTLFLLNKSWLNYTQEL